MAVSQYALVTVEEAQTYLGITASGEALTRLEMLIDGVSAALDDEYQTYFVKRAWTEVHAGGIGHRRGFGRRVHLHRAPIEAVVSVVDGEGTEVDADDYLVLGDLGILEHHTRWPLPVYRWSVTVSGGWFEDTAGVAADVKLEALSRVAARYQDPEGREAESVKVGDLQISYGGSAAGGTSALGAPGGRPRLSRYWREGV